MRIKACKAVPSTAVHSTQPVYTGTQLHTSAPEGVYKRFDGRFKSRHVVLLMSGRRVCLVYVPDATLIPSCPTNIPMGPYVPCQDAVMHLTITGVE